MPRIIHTHVSFCGPSFLCAGLEMAEDVRQDVAAGPPLSAGREPLRRGARGLLSLPFGRTGERASAPSRGRQQREGGRSLEEGAGRSRGGGLGRREGRRSTDRLMVYAEAGAGRRELGGAGSGRGGAGAGRREGRRTTTDARTTDRLMVYAEGGAGRRELGGAGSGRG